jgi:hypothetical protein
MQKTIKALPWIQRGVIFAAFLFGLAALGAASAQAGEVTNLNDSGPGSLRQAIISAAAGDTIIVRIKGTITLTSDPLVIGKKINIEGPGAKRLTISGNHARRVFVIVGGPVTLAGMTISDGLADGNSPISVSIGGAIFNAANLTLFDVVVSDSQALGDKSKRALTALLRGGAFGGGIANTPTGVLTVTNSSFMDNVARGGDDSIYQSGDGLLAGPAGGGGIANFGRLTITESRFSFNQAVGGNNCVSPYLSGHGYGGAIASGAPGALMDVQDSGFDHNQAIGGNGNTSPVPATVGPNKSSGGAIDVTGGTATITNCTLDHNLSVGGTGAPGADGGIGAGGAIVATNFAGYATNAKIIDSTVEHNIALGGPGGSGGNGGEGEGGGLTSTAGAILTVIDTTVAHNHAQGGEGIKGGNGFGGGLYNYTASPLNLQGAIVNYNLAIGGEAEEGGSDGQGIGGGVYHLGPYSADSATVITKNQATTSDNNVGP